MMHFTAFSLFSGKSASALYGRVPPGKVACCFVCLQYAGHYFLDAIASLEFVYESLLVTSKLNIGYISKHGAIIEYTLNVY